MPEIRQTLDQARALAGREDTEHFALAAPGLLARLVHILDLYVGHEPTLAEEAEHERATHRAEVLAEGADLIEQWQNDRDDAAAEHHGGLTDTETAAHIAVRRAAKHLRAVAEGGEPAAAEEAAPSFFQPGHAYTHRDGSDFRCVAVTTHPNTGEARAFGWRIRNGWHEGATLDPDDWQQYDGCPPPAGDESTESVPEAVTRVRTEYALTSPEYALHGPYLIAARDHQEAALVAADSPGTQIVQRTVTTTTGPWTKAGN